MVKTTKTSKTQGNHDIIAGRPGGAAGAGATARAIAAYDTHLAELTGERGGAGKFLEVSDALAARFAREHQGEARRVRLAWLAGAVARARDIDRREGAEDVALEATPSYIVEAIERDAGGAHGGLRAITEDGLWRFTPREADEVDPWAPGGEHYVSSVPGEGEGVRAVVPMGYGGLAAGALLAFEHAELTGGWEVAARVALLGEVFGGLLAGEEFDDEAPETPEGEPAPWRGGALAMAREAARTWRAKTPTVDSAMREVGRGVLTGRVNLDEAIMLYGEERILSAVTFAVLDGVEHVLDRVRSGQRAVRWFPTYVGGFARTKADERGRARFMPASTLDGVRAYRRALPEGLVEVACELAPRRVYTRKQADALYPLLQEVA